MEVKDDDELGVGPYALYIPSFTADQIVDGWTFFCIRTVQEIFGVFNKTELLIRPSSLYTEPGNF